MAYSPTARTSTITEIVLPAAVTSENRIGLPSHADGSGVALRNTAGSAGRLSGVIVISTSGPRRSTTAARITSTAGASAVTGACAPSAATAHTTTASAARPLANKAGHMRPLLVRRVH